MSFLVREGSQRWAHSGGSQGAGGGGLAGMRPLAGSRRRQSSGAGARWGRPSMPHGTCAHVVCSPRGQLMGVRRGVRVARPAGFHPHVRPLPAGLRCTAGVRNGGSGQLPDAGAGAAGYLAAEVREARAAVAALDRALGQARTFKDASFELADQAHLAMSRLEQVRRRARGAGRRQAAW